MMVRKLQDANSELAEHTIGQQVTEEKLKKPKKHSNTSDQGAKALIRGDNHVDIAQSTSGKKKEKKRKADREEAVLAKPDPAANNSKTAAAPQLIQKPKKKKRKLLDGTVEPRPPLTVDATKSSAEPAPVKKLLTKLKKKVKASLGIADRPAAQPLLEPAVYHQSTDLLPASRASAQPNAVPTGKQSKQDVSQRALNIESADLAPDPVPLPKPMHSAGSKKPKKKKAKQMSAQGDGPVTAIPADESVRPPAATNGESHSEHDVKPSATQQQQSAPGRTPGSGRAFQRVKSDEWMTSKAARDNSYKGTFGQSGWGAKAQETLGQVRGKNFRHEMTKKKRGTYRGGLIESGAVNSFKFDSDSN